MIKNGYLSKKDIGEKEYFRLANGEISEGTKINLKELIIGDILLQNVKASIVHELNAPLLLGQSALSKLGIIEINYNNNTLTIKGNDLIKVPNLNSTSDEIIFNSRSEKLNVKAVVIGETGAAIWDGPNLGSTKLGRIPKGGELTYIEKGKIRSKIKYENIEGYVGNEYLYFY